MGQQKREGATKMGAKAKTKKGIGKFTKEVAKHWQDNLSLRLGVVERPGHKPEAESQETLQMNIRAVGRLSNWAMTCNHDQVGRGASGLLILENHRSLEIKEQVLDAMADIIGFWELNCKKDPISAITACQILQNAHSLTISDEAKSLEDTLTSQFGIRAH